MGLAGLDGARSLWRAVDGGKGRRLLDGGDLGKLRVTRRGKWIARGKWELVLFLCCFVVFVLGVADMAQADVVCFGGFIEISENTHFWGYSGLSYSSSLLSLGFTSEADEERVCDFRPRTDISGVKGAREMHTVG